MQIVLLRSFFILENCPSVGSAFSFSKRVLTTGYLMTLLSNNPAVVSVEVG